MSDNSTSTRLAGMSESAFGRPASWWTAWPALAVGLGAFLLAVYGTLWLPRRLPTQYAHALEQAQQQYQQLAEKSKTSGGQRLIDAAGNLDVIYSRLVALEGNSPERYWQWSEFQQLHAARLQRSLSDPALSLSAPVRKRWLEQANQFQAKSTEILEQLAVRPSELQAKALLKVAQRKYRTGLGEFGVREAGKLADELSSALDDSNSAPQGTAALNAEETQAAQLLLVQLHMEAAWEVEPRSSLTVDRTRLETAWTLSENFRTERPHLENELVWRTTRGLLAALTGRESIETTAITAQESNASLDPQSTWEQDLAQLQLLAIDGAWADIAGQLQARLEPAEPAVTSGLARTICRLAVSPLASEPQTRTPDDGQASEEVGNEHNGDENREEDANLENKEKLNDTELRAALSWAEQSQLGLLIAVQLGVHLPECSELIWECARIQAGQGSENITISAAIPQSIMGGQSGWLKHSLAALSATLNGQAELARSHLQLLGRMRGSPSLISRVALWRAHNLAASLNSETSTTTELSPNAMHELQVLSELLSDVVQIEPDSGLNWFVLGTLQFRTGDFASMRTSLAKASELLGEVPAIDQMLDAASEVQ